MRLQRGASSAATSSATLRAMAAGQRCLSLMFCLTPHFAISRPLPRLCSATCSACGRWPNMQATALMWATALIEKLVAYLPKGRIESLGERANVAHRDYWCYLDCLVSVVWLARILPLMK